MSSVIYYCTDPLQHGIYLFYVTTNQNFVEGDVICASVPEYIDLSTYHILITSNLQEGHLSDIHFVDKSFKQPNISCFLKF